MGRARLVVFGCEVGGRWSTEASNFLSALAEAKARCEPENGAKVRNGGLVVQMERSHGVHGCSRFRLVTVGPQMLCCS